MDVLKIANVLDKLRVMPRIMVGVAIYAWYDTLGWFMALEDPSMNQAGLISVVTGAVTTWAGIYMNTGAKKDV